MFENRPMTFLVLWIFSCAFIMADCVNYNQIIRDSLKRRVYFEMHSNIIKNP